MKKILLPLGCFIGTIAGLVIIKMLDLPVLVTIVLVAGLMIGMIFAIATLMRDPEKKETAQGGTTEEKA